MSSLQIRELPDNIYNLLQKKANAEHRSLAQEAVVVLAKGLNISLSPKSRREELLQTIADSQYDNEALAQLDPVDLIREDRQR
jgi:plasmid stability protein